MQAATHNAAHLPDRHSWRWATPPCLAQIHDLNCGHSLASGSCARQVEQPRIEVQRRVAARASSCDCGLRHIHAVPAAMESLARTHSRAFDIGHMPRPAFASCAFPAAVCRRLASAANTSSRVLGGRTIPTAKCRRGLSRRPHIPASPTIGKNSLDVARDPKSSIANCVSVVRVAGKSRQLCVSDPFHRPQR